MINDILIITVGTKMHYFKVCILLIVTALLSACVPVPNIALGLLKSGNSKQAWEMISEEMKKPTATSQEDLCELHLATLQILNGIVKYHFAPANPDVIAANSHEYVLNNCRAFEKKQGIAENLYGNYFYNTGRPGLAMQQYSKSMLLKDQISFGRMVDEFNLGVVYGTMGQFSLRDFYVIKSIDTGRKYFKSKRTYKNRFRETVEYLEYYKILKARMEHLSWSDDRAASLTEMHKRWNETESIASEWFSKSTLFLTYISAAQNFSTAGEFEFAKKLMVEAKVLNEKYPYKQDKAMMDIKSAEAKILFDEGKYKESAELFEDWINKFQKLSGKPPSANDYRLAGLAQESAEKYDLAIEYLERAISAYEKIRSGFKVRSRGEFLSGLILKSYWGLIRSYAARYLKTQSENDFRGAMNAEKMLRARQFGELISIDKTGWSYQNVSSLKLTPDELLLNYVLTDSVIVLFAVSSDRQNLLVIPYDSKKFGNEVKRVRDQLMTPGNTEKLHSDLNNISTKVIMPISNRLDRGKKLIVMTDGYLNGIPFAVLSKSQNQYVPLIRDHEVIMTPSISYLTALRNIKERMHFEKKLFAVADPVYGSDSLPRSPTGDAEISHISAAKDFNLFKALPETKTEVEKISLILGSANSTLLYGSNASKANLKTKSLTGYQYLHFATHGVLGNQIPGVYEPALVLSVGKSYMDSFLTMSEIEQLKLNSDLTVLSACDTGSGKYYTGEGVMGMSRGFLLAGSHSVLATLWPIDSVSTVTFMTNFYRHLQKGKSKSESLRLAQLELMADKKTTASGERGISITGDIKKQATISHPYYWSPFVLTGE